MPISRIPCLGELSVIVLAIIFCQRSALAGSLVPVACNVNMTAQKYIEATDGVVLRLAADGSARPDGRRQ